jgi:hypothetical protein
MTSSVFVCDGEDEIGFYLTLLKTQILRRWLGNEFSLLGKLLLLVLPDISGCLRNGVDVIGDCCSVGGFFAT